ncbi:MAG: glycosyltransferase [Flavobacteriaceae bacterium]|nr:MAG: glycosyltransferase [Flavobacteriaceae bacterium]
MTEILGFPDTFFTAIKVIKSSFLSLPGSLKSDGLKRLLLGLIKKMKFLPPPFYVRVYYKYYTGKKLNLEDPREFNEKIQWLKVYYKDPRLTRLVDKYSVRSYVKEKVGEKYLNQLLGVYERPGDVDFSSLPEKFVIKGVHGCNWNLIVEETSELVVWKARLKFRKWLSRNYYYRSGLEWAYKNVKPRLIAEAYLEEVGRKSINDYKFFCFNGKPRFIQIDLERKESHSRRYYDLDWQPLTFTDTDYPPFKDSLERPPNYEEMVEVATRLADDFPFVRVDLYNLGGRIVFGEMTFYPADGRLEFVPDQYNRIIGDYLILPEPLG